MSAQVIIATWRAANSRPLHTHWWVVPFNRTGCIRYVVMAMNHRRYIGCTMYRVIPFNRTGCIRNVAGGRLPPLQTRW